MSEFEPVLRLVAGLMVGVAIGWQRTLRHKSAGIRTFGLVGLGTAVAAMLFDGAAHPDAAGRVVQGVLTGVGFLGAGLIVRRQDETVPHGLTTAAAVWVTATLGCAAGLGQWLVTSVATVLVLALLLLDHSIEHWARRREARPPEDKNVS